MTLNSHRKQSNVLIVLIYLVLSFFVMGQASHAATLAYNGDTATVTDLESTLMWQRCTAPSTEINCTISPAPYNWDNALAYCNGLSLAGHTGWRLPNVKELQSILDVTKAAPPSINTLAFPDTQAAYYWSSTTSVGTTSYAWYVNFDISGAVFAMTSGINKTGGQYVRCVRGG